MKPLVWHWGRRGAGPLFATRLVAAMRELEGCAPRLSLAAGAEILAQPDAPACDWREPTYASAPGFLVQRLAGPLLAGRTLRRLRQIGPDFALCAMPSLLDSRMLTALRRTRIPYAAIVHDAYAHPGDSLSFRVLGQRALLRGAKILFPLTEHVQAGLVRQGFGRDGQKIVKLWHPPIDLGPITPPLSHSGRPRFLYFGRLLPYKGLDLLAEALESLGAALPFELRVCGEGPQLPGLARLRAIPGVSVERRWFADSELPGLLAWSDALLLPYREASQSGVAALAIAAGRHVLATKVGGLPEQLSRQANAHFCAPTGPAIAQALAQLSVQLSGVAPVLAALPRPDAQAGWRALASAMLVVMAENRGEENWLPK